LLKQDGYQKQYFVLKSFEDGAEKLREYCATITPPHIMALFSNKATPVSSYEPQIRAGQL